MYHPNQPSLRSEAQKFKFQERKQYYCFPQCQHKKCRTIGKSGKSQGKGKRVKIVSGI